MRRGLILIGLLFVTAVTWAQEDRYDIKSGTDTWTVYVYEIKKPTIKFIIGYGSYMRKYGYVAVDYLTDRQEDILLKVIKHYKRGSYHIDICKYKTDIVVTAIIYDYDDDSLWVWVK